MPRRDDLHRIMLIGWDFDYRTAFEADGGSLPGPNHLGPFLHWLVWRRPHLSGRGHRLDLQGLPPDHHRDQDGGD